MVQPKDTDWLNRYKDLCIHCLKGTHFRSRDTYRLKVKEWKKYSMPTEIRRKLE